MIIVYTVAIINVAFYKDESMSNLIKDNTLSNSF